MTSFDVPKRAVPVHPSHHAPSVHSPATLAAREPEDAAAAMPTALAGGLRVPTPPAGVSHFVWEMLVVNVGDAQRHSATSVAPLREAVQALVWELRAASQPWEQIYVVLQSAVTPAPEREVSFAMGYEVHSSRSAALVAHMQSWADVERLAEIEAESHGDYAPRVKPALPQDERSAMRDTLTWLVRVTPRP